MNPISKQFSSIEQVTGQYLKQKKRNQSVKDVGCFIRRCLTATATVKVFKACLAAVRKQKYQLIRGTECQTRRRSGTGTCQGD